MTSIASSPHDWWICSIVCFISSRPIGSQSESLPNTPGCPSQADYTLRRFSYKCVIGEVRYGIPINSLTVHYQYLSVIAHMLIHLAHDTYTGVPVVCPFRSSPLQEYRLLRHLAESIRPLSALPSVRQRCQTTSLTQSCGCTLRHSTNWRRHNSALS